MGDVTPIRRSQVVEKLREEIRVSMATALNSGASLKDVEDTLLDIFTRTRKIGDGSLR